MRSTRLRRGTLYAGSALLWLAGLALTAAWFALARSDRPVSGSASLPGLSASVELLVDSLGVPHVLAQTELDAFAALGYLHAADRMWQMELFRRIASGRLAEIFGETALETDRFVRTLGLWTAAREAAGSLAPAEARRLEAYARGVNARLAERGAPPPEFRILRVRPEPWDAISILGVRMVMNLDLAVWRNDLSRFWAARNLGAEYEAWLRGGYPEWGPTILAESLRPPAGATAGAVPDVAEDASAVSAAAPPRRAVPGASAAGAAAAPAAVGAGGPWDPFVILGSASARSASNSWVIAGERTASGAPILANDMHLSLRAPSLWYVAALHGDADGLHVAGFTLPGVPGVVVGHNRDVAWGFTNGMVDDTDFVVETLSEDGTRYRDGGAWLPLTVRAETLAVRGRDAPEILEVRSTRRGPLLSDRLPGLGAALSVLWVGSGSDDRTLGIGEMNRASDADGLEAAIRSFPRPHQNVVYATRDGTIGYRLGGRIPLRGGRDGAIPAPADSVGGGWAGYWPRDAHPAGRNPRSGYLVTANNLQAPGLGRAISTDYAAPFRALRITRALEVRRDWTPASVYALQHDTRSPLADRVLPRAVDAARRSGREDEARLLEGWDRVVDVDSRAAPLFYSWFYRLRALIAADEWAGGERWASFPIDAMLRTLEEEDASPWVDDVRTPERETLASLEERAMEDAARVTGGASWGELHRERHAHPLGGIAWLDRLLGLDFGPYPEGGGPDTLRPDDYRVWNALDASSWTPPWTGEYGPSERFVAHLRPSGIEAGFLLPTGQSGNPFSRHYRDMNRLWRGGALVPVPLDLDAARARADRRASLLPAPSGTEDEAR
ncbi:MAG: penicillin acylase family protein [Gemmatimonadota bacterium]